VEPGITIGPGTTGIQAVLFDLDGTLYRQRPLRSLMALELLTLPLSGPWRAPRRWRALQAYRSAQERLREAASPDAAHQQLAAAASASGLPVAEVEALVSEWMLERPLKYLQFCRMTGLDTLLTVLDRRGLKMGVLSDYPATAKLRALGLEGRFFPVLTASDSHIGAFKPSPRGYLRACEVWGVEPAQVLFVGDRADVDAVGAAAAGMPCVIVGRTPRAAAPATHVMFSSFEELTRVFERR
jgi:HAD superfamily hydrolase (TIGR01509 family)